MSNIIVFRDFKGLIISGEVVSLTKGDKLYTIIKNQSEYVCFNENRLITSKYSENYVNHFALNDDGNGLLRGNLTYQLCRYPYTSLQIDLLKQKWGFLLKPSTQAFGFNKVIFANCFFDLDIPTLKNIINFLRIEVN